MIQDKPSKTAHRVALRRAVHQLFDHPKVFDDPVALKIVGRDAMVELEAAKGSDSTPGRYLRAFLVARSRFAEDCLGAAVSRRRRYRLGRKSVSRGLASGARRT